MKPDQKGNKKRKAYEKPRLRVINLVADQVLAIGCKTLDPGFFPPNVAQPFGCGVNKCFKAGT